MLITLASKRSKEENDLKVKFLVKLKTLPTVPAILNPVYEPGPRPTITSSISWILISCSFKKFSKKSTSVSEWSFLPLLAN